MQTFFMDFVFLFRYFTFDFFKMDFLNGKLLALKIAKTILALPDVAQCLLDYVETDVLGATLGDKGYLYTLAQCDKPNVFHSCLKKCKVDFA